jgi:hypothetical protein
MKGVLLLSPYMPSENFCSQSEGSSSTVFEETGHKRVSCIHVVTGYCKDVQGLPDATEVRQILD